MKNFLTTCVLLCQSAAFADWLPASQTIPEGTSTEVAYDVYTAYDPTTQRVMATWVESITSLPFYALYNGSAWTTPGTPIPLGTSTGGYYNVVPIAHEASGIILALWADATTQAPFYAANNATSWITSGTGIPIGTSTGVYVDVHAAYNPNTSAVIATWADATTQAPFYALFDGTIWTTPGTAIPLGASLGVQDDVLLTYNAANQRIVAAWADSATQAPFYAIFDGTTWITPGTPIPLGTSTGVDYNVNLVYDAANQMVVAAWGDASTHQPFYALFDGTSWITPGVIPQGTSTGVYQSVSMTYDPVGQSVIAAWSDLTNFVPFYTLFNGISWTTATAVPVAPSAGIDYDIILTYVPNTNQTLATWANYPGDADPYFNVFVNIAAPSTITATTCRLAFASQRVWVTQLTWPASTTLDVVAYNIYRDGVLLGSVAADTLFYNDTVKLSGIYIYGVTAVNSTGEESAQATISVAVGR